MRGGALLLPALAAALAAAVPAAAQAPTGAASLWGNKYQGDGTYYGDWGGQGACSYQFSGTVKEPWSDGIALRVAMNSRQWHNSEVCGMCLRFKGFNKGAGANPVTEQVRYVQVTNLCPECHTGDLDQELNGDGRWLIEWEPVQCNVGYTSFVYSFQGSNGYFIKLQVANARVPVRSVWWGARGKWWPMARTGDNYFQMQSPDGQAFELPARLAIRSIFNDTVYDTIALSQPSGRVKGSVQFPYDPSKPRVPGAARFESGGAEAPPKLGGTVDGSPAAAPSAGPALKAQAPAAPSMAPVAVIPPAGAESAATPPSGSPPAPSTSNSLWPFGTLGWPPGWGGSGARRAAVGGGGGGASTEGDKAASAASSPWGAWPASSPAAASTESADNVASVCQVAVETHNQCGGRGGYCSGPQCADGVWEGACCLQPGARCVRFDELYWECRMNPFPVERYEL